MPKRIKVHSSSKEEIMIFIDHIVAIENRSYLSSTNSYIHTDDGDGYLCVETTEEIEKLIDDAKP